MSFNLEQNGRPIVKIIEDGKKDRIVYLDEKSESEHNYPALMLKENQRFQLIPDKTKERTIHYVCGASGSGKSYWTANLANEYKKLFSKNPVYNLSTMESDEIIDRVRDAKRITLSKEFLNTELDENSVDNCLTIWDDCDSIIEKKMKQHLREFSLAILNRGRHTKTSMIYLSHIACDGVATKPILGECHSITFFPATLGGKTRRYLLDNYLGLDKKQIERIGKMESRAITILKTYPQVVISEKEIVMVKNL
jgi:hypothetical protein